MVLDLGKKQHQRLTAVLLMELLLSEIFLAPEFET